MMNNYIVNSFIIIISALLISCIEPSLIISFDSPAIMWEESLPLGNGRLGAMPNGGILEETLVLNEETMWSGSEWDPVNPEALKWLPIIRQKLMEGNNIKAENINKLFTFLKICDIIKKGKDYDLLCDSF